MPSNTIIKRQLNLPIINWILTLTGLKGFKKFLAEQLYHPASLDSAWNVHSLPWCCTSPVVSFPLYQVIFGSGLPSTGQGRVTWVPSRAWRIFAWGLSVGGTKMKKINNKWWTLQDISYTDDVIICIAKNLIIQNYNVPWVIITC